MQRLRQPSLEWPDGSVSLSVMMRCVSLLVLCLALPSCGWLSDPADERPETPEGPLLVGRVASVHPGEGFVLVEGFDVVKLQEGRILTSRGQDGRNASLEVTGERSGRYTAADHKAGEVQVGDAVFARPLDIEPSTIHEDIEKNPVEEP